MGQRKWKRKTRIRMPKGERNNNPTAADSSSSSAPPPPWIELPIDVTANILRRLSPEEILFSAQIVCTTWRSVCADPFIWRVLDVKYSDTGNRRRHALRVCRRAVDRSQGELIDINIRQYGNDRLIRYISKRSSHLKILSLESCRDISPWGLTAAVKKFPHLEELHLFFFWEMSDMDIENIGVSCPMLNSFTFNSPDFEFQLEDIIDNSLALSIAKNMPNLRRLRIVGNWLNNEGLLAILDGCPNLELLDLLHCHGVDLQCDLGRRCSEHVKELRGPFDSIVDCEWDARVYDPKDVDDFSDGYPNYNSMGFDSCFEDDLF